jgi:phosphoenolpyruvate carboxylase
MTSVLPASAAHMSEELPNLPLRRRLKLVEELWEAVLVQECGQEMVTLLHKLLDLCSPEGQADSTASGTVLQLVEALELNEAIKAARAFALYFQLINIVEQHFEQRDQRRQYRTGPSADTPPTKGYWEQHHGGETLYSNNSDEADQSALGTSPNLPKRRGVGTFPWLFPRLKELNVPPATNSAVAGSTGSVASVYGAPDGDCAAYDSGQAAPGREDFVAAR